MEKKHYRFEKASLTFGRGEVTRYHVRMAIKREEQCYVNTKLFNDSRHKYLYIQLMKEEIKEAIEGPHGRHKNLKSIY